MHRPEHGTWLGVTRQGRLACLTNFREATATFVEGRRSRGAIVNAYLRTPPESNESSSDIASKLVTEGLSGVGGFSLLFGHLKKPPWKDVLSNDDREKWKGLAIVSNRSEHVEDVKWLCTESGETHALSNAHYGDTSWPKVVKAENLVVQAIPESISGKENADELISRLLEILSLDTLPKQRSDEGWDTYLGHLRSSIFIPSIGKYQERRILDIQSPLPNGQADIRATVRDEHATSGMYGTQKQSVILVDWNGKVTYFERTLFEKDGRPITKGKGDVKFGFNIEGW